MEREIRVTSGSDLNGAKIRRFPQARRAGRNVAGGVSHRISGPALVKPQRGAGTLAFSRNRPESCLSSCQFKTALVLLLLGLCARADFSWDAFPQSLDILRRLVSAAEQSKESYLTPMASFNSREPAGGLPSRHFVTIPFEPMNSALRSSRPKNHV